jgi:hypothetical protein
MPINRVAAIETTGFQSGNLSPFIWQPINPLGMEQACFEIRIANNSAFDVLISYDGVTAHEVASPYTTVDLVFQANSRTDNHVALMPVGTRVYVMGQGVEQEMNLMMIDPKDDIFLSGYYQPTQ